MSSSPPVRAVVRAIDLLQALNRQAVSTLDVLHAQTGMPKPTLVRLLQTFENRGIVKHAPQHGAYFLTSGVRSLSSGYHSEPMIVEAAAPLMDELTLRVKWPTAVAMLDHSAMVVRYSTIPLSPLSMRHSTINFRLSLVTRALGRAYLAFCPSDQQEALLKDIQTSPHQPEDEAVRDRGALDHVLAKVHDAGYALRDPTVVPATNTLAVPVFDTHGVAATLGMTFFSSTMKPEQAVERYLADLQAVARQVSGRLKELQATA
ncbi:DNA-binding transcriptional regulator [Hydrogenophaga sp. BPS33]|uniref:DNA-binding transcriptional regulator n=1 Tax=Hydrogenophaga sp. BPS33 TaxID=2651974 RepID=UPI00131FE2EA|nr:DNA-binding transcriptional regulator [Hydrogenophaga sp. BPS33]QHE87275.1 DNA-binding transcriptional regulator [Hydrogenophaga sp. BPS33]